MECKPNNLVNAAQIVGTERLDSGAKLPSGFRILQPAAPHSGFCFICSISTVSVSSLTRVSGLIIRVNSPLASLIA